MALVLIMILYDALTKFSVLKNRLIVNYHKYCMMMCFMDRMYERATIGDKHRVCANLVQAAKL